MESKKAKIVKKKKTSVKRRLQGRRVGEQERSGLRYKRATSTARSWRANNAQCREYSIVLESSDLLRV